MVHHHQHNRKQDSGELHHLLPFISSDHHCFVKYRNSKPTLLRVFFLFLIFSLTCVFVAIFQFSYYPSYFDQGGPGKSEPPCSSSPNNTICCDRTAFRTDVCFMKGDVRTNSASNSVFLVSPASSYSSQEERIRPYTRKWEKDTMDRIDELRLAVRGNGTGACDVRHDVPAVFFSTGGYTGNVYHEFNDGIIPLYITSHRFNRKVVFVLLEYHDWWISKYENILSQLSDFAPIDFSNDSRTHCFPEAIVGLRIHDELTIDPTKMTSNKTIRDFRQLLDESYKPRIQAIQGQETATASKNQSQKRNLVILSRNGSRAIENENELVKLAEEIGFRVEVLRPTPRTELAKIYHALNSSDVMIGVHGAAMTHLLFMRPGSVFIQIVPLGTDWAAEAYYGEPAMKLGLKYMRYAILPKESSLYREYKEDDPVLKDPESVNAQGWEMTKKVYLDGQNVRLDLRRFGKRLVKAHQHSISEKGSQSFNEHR